MLVPGGCHLGSPQRGGGRGHSSMCTESRALSDVWPFSMASHGSGQHTAVSGDTR